MVVGGFFKLCFGGFEQFFGAVVYEYVVFEQLAPSGGAVFVQNGDGHAVEGLGFEGAVNVFESEVVAISA